MFLLSEATTATTIVETVAENQSPLSNIIAIILAIIIGGGFGYKLYGSFKSKGYVDIKDIQKLASSLLVDDELMAIIGSVFSCDNVDFSKYKTLAEFISDRIDALEDNIYNFIQSNPKVDPLLKKLVTKENISGITDFIITKSGFDNELLENQYNSYLESIKEEPTVEEDDNSKKVVDTYENDVKNMNNNVSIYTPEDNNTVQPLELDHEDTNESIDNKEDSTVEEPKEKESRVEFIEVNTVDFSSKEEPKEEVKEAKTKKSTTRKRSTTKKTTTKKKSTTK